MKKTKHIRYYKEKRYIDGYVRNVMIKSTLIITSVKEDGKVVSSSCEVTEELCTRANKYKK